MKYIKKKSIVGIPAITGSISDTINIKDKTINTYSARIIDELIGIEIIKNENGTAIKYADGRMECYCSKNYGKISYKTQYLNFTRCPSPLEWNFPVEFIETPNVNYGIYVGGGICYSSLSHKPTTKLCKIWIGYYESTELETEIYWKATGYWK